MRLAEGPWPSRLAVAIGLALLLFFTRDYPGSWADLSRLAAAWAISEHGGWRIDTPDNKFGRFTGDKALIAGHYYSDKPPVMAALAGGLAFGLKAFGSGFAKASRQTVYLLTLLLVGLPFLAYLYMLGRGQKSFQACLLALFGSLALPYAFVFNNHLPAGCLLGLVWLRRSKESAGLSAGFLDGLLLGLAPTLDPAAALAGGPMAVWVLIFRLKGWPSRLAFILAGLIPLGLHAALTIPLTGDLRWPSLHPEFMIFPGARLRPTELTGVGGLAWGSPKDWLAYLFGLSLGAKGFFSHNPITILGLIGLGVVLAGKQVEKDRLLAGALLLGSGATMAYYSLFSNNFGGYNYSVRWFVVLVPLLLPYALRLLDQLQGGWRRAGLAIAWASAGMCLAAWPNPWLPSHQEAFDLIAGFKLWSGFPFSAQP